MRSSPSSTELNQDEMDKLLSDDSMSLIHRKRDTVESANAITTLRYPPNNKAGGAFESIRGMDLISYSIIFRTSEVRIA